MSRKNGYRLTTANLKTRGLTNEEYQQQRLEIAATELLEHKAKYRKGKKKAYNPGKKKRRDWPGKIPYSDWQHMQSIKQEVKHSLG